MSDFDVGSEAGRWNHHPGQVRLNPLFTWPLDIRAVLQWYRGAWLQITGVTLPFVVAIIGYALFLPPLEQMQTLSLDWIARIWLLSLVPQTLLAGGLHYFLYVRHSQGMTKKFDKRDLTRSSAIFTFKNQVWDNIWWTLGSAITVSTVYQVLLFWAMANGWTPLVTFAAAPVWFVLWMAIVPIWSGLHFYWVHRLEHSPRLFKHVHAVHHRNVNVGPWSGISNHWYENLFYFSGYFIHLIVPSNPLHVMFHVYFQQLSPVLSHSGFEKIVKDDSDMAKAGDFFHQLHHRYFECNYGTSEIPFDRWFGTFHDGSANATRATKAHKKRMYTGRQGAAPEDVRG
ncbi:MAG: sterol desaturase family protein [Pseudomonadota bacterium]